MNKVISNVKNWTADHKEETALIKKMVVATTACLAVSTVAGAILVKGIKSCDSAQE